MVDEGVYKFNPIIFSAIFIAFVFYTGLFSIKEDDDSFVSLVKLTDVNIIEGIVSGSPVKTHKGNNYLVNIIPSKVTSKNGIESSCKGKIPVLLKASAVEAYFPDKLFSKSNTSGAILCDNGANLKITGSYLLNAKLFSMNKVEQLDWSNNWTGVINHFRATTRLEFRRLLCAWGDAGGFLLALLAGMKEYTNIALYENFQKSGLSHILALSGMHLSLFSGISFFFLKNITGKRIASIINIFVIIIFVWFVGKSPSLIRALIFSLVAMFFSIFNIKNKDFFTIFSLSFLIHCGLFPKDIFNIGFILSYGALLGIILFSCFFEQKIIFSLPHKLSSSVASSISAQVFTAPVCLFSFGYFPIVGIFSTVIISPFVNIFIYVGLFLVVLCFCFPICVPIGEFILKIIYNVIENFAYIFACFPCIKI